MYRFFKTLVILCIYSTAHAASEAVPLQIEVDNNPASAGYYQLSWDNPNERPIELQEALDADFDTARTLWRGPAESRFVSGKSDGEYFYRLRYLGNDHKTTWGPVTRVEVEHHSLQQAGWWFGLGLMVFIIILIAIWHGQAEERSRG